MGSPTSVSLPAVLPSSFTATPEEIFILTMMSLFHFIMYTKIIGASMSKPNTCGENCLYIYIIILYIGIREKSSNFDSSVETKVIEIIVLLKELDNGKVSEMK